MRMRFVMMLTFDAIMRKGVTHRCSRINHGFKVQRLSDERKNYEVGPRFQMAPDGRQFGKGAEPDHAAP